MGSVGHLRTSPKDQGPVQGQRHHKPQGDANELAFHSLSSAGAHHAAWAGLLHGSLQQEQVWLLPYRRQKHFLPPFDSQQDSKDALTMTFFSFFFKLFFICKYTLDKNLS